MYVAIPAAQATLETVAAAVYVPVALTIRYDVPWVGSFPPEAAVEKVPSDEKLFNGANAEFRRSMPKDPISNSFAWAVVVVAPELAAVLLPVACADLSNGVDVRPVTTNASASLRLEDGWVTVIVVPTAMAVVTGAEKMTVRIAVKVVSAFAV